MMPISAKDQTYFLSIVHITQQAPDQFIYGMLINEQRYYLSKKFGVNDCRQLDNRPRLQVGRMLEICRIITTFEKTYRDYHSLELINQQIIESLAKLSKSTRLV